MFCQKCGKDAGDEKFCPGCGAEMGADSSKPTNIIATSENTAGLFTYVLGWVSGIVFIIIDKRPYVRFHAMQSIIVFGSLSILNIILSGFTSILPYGLWFIPNLINKLLSLGGFILWVLLIIKAYQGNFYKLPIIGDYAERLSKNVKL